MQVMGTLCVSHVEELVSGAGSGLASLHLKSSPLGRVVPLSGNRQSLQRLEPQNTENRARGYQDRKSVV